MASPIEDYALLGDARSAALVDRTGSIDWLAVPDFESPACFAALLGTEHHGHWRVAPAGTVTPIERRYLDDTLLLETEFTTAEGTVAVIDCLVPTAEHPTLIRVVEGRQGRVTLDLSLRIRFDYGSIVPWVRTVDGRLFAVGGPDSLVLDTPVELHGEDHSSAATFTVGPGDRVPFTLTWFGSHESPPEPVDVDWTLRKATNWWLDWSSKTTYDGEYAGDVAKSIRVLKALTHQPTGGIVAAATTSLPEQLGGGRNWDCRFCWLRDSTFTLAALLLAGHETEARAWRDWLLRAVAGDPSRLQIMYGTHGRRRLTELELDWLPGYEGSAPVRVGNGASGQFQLDVYGEVMDTVHIAREGAFLLCSFWLADNLALIGRNDDARALYQRLLDLRNDVGLLSEEYDVAGGRMLGNFPQAFSHVAMVNTAMNICGRTRGPAERRSDPGGAG